MSLGDPSVFWFLVLLGCASGFISGLLGVGGGAILVPALIAGLPLLGVNGPEVPKIAMATSLALIVPTAIASAQTHASKGAIDWMLLGLLCPSTIAGSFVAAAFAKGLPTQLLCVLFVIFALYTAWGLMQRHQARPTHDRQAGVQPGLIRITATGVLGGAFSSLLGLGVAFFAVPIMTRFIAVPRAIGTAAALCIPMALAGVAGHMLGGTPDECRDTCAGHIYLPAVAAIGITAVLTAPMGARFTHVLPVILMRRLFALFLLTAAAQLAYKFVPVKSGIEQGRLFLARLTMPARTGVPVAGEAPGWLTTAIPNAQLALVAQYGPRRAFLAWARADEDGAAGFFMLGATPGTDIWRIKRTGMVAADKPASIQALKIASGAAAAVVPALPERNVRKSATAAKRQRDEPAGGSIRQPLTGPGARLGARPAHKSRTPALDARNSQSGVTDPFGFFAAPGASKAEDWSN